MTINATIPAGTRVQEAIASAAAYLQSEQRPDGSWQDHLPSSAVSTGAALIALHASGPERYAAELDAGALWLRRTQSADGSWGDTPDGDRTVNATAIAVAALNLVAGEESTEPVARGLAYLEREGGRAMLEDRARCTLSTVCLNYLALSGLYPEARLARLPLQLVLFPSRLQRKLCFTLPGLYSWGVMQARRTPPGPILRLLDRLAEPRALRWLDEVQHFEDYQGGFEESPLMAAIVCFGLTRGGAGEAIAARCRDYLLQTRRADGSWAINRDLEFSASMFVAAGLQEAGYGERLDATREWVLHCQRQVALDATGCPAGGWGWSLPSGWPNTDDTSSALMVLAGFGLGPAAPAVRDGVGWLLAQQNGNGSWGCFVRGGRVSLDAPSPEMTAHAVIALHKAAGMSAHERPVARALRWLASVQRSDGAVPALWYRNWTAGTAAVLDAFATCGLAHHPVAKRCSAWLLANQRADGGWGGEPGDDASAEETAWALAALMTAGLPASDPRAQHAASFLAETQLPAGGWRPSIVGIYFSSLMYHDDHLANGYVLQALARYRRALAAEAR